MRWWWLHDLKVLPITLETTSKQDPSFSSPSDILVHLVIFDAHLGMRLISFKKDKTAGRKTETSSKYVKTEQLAKLSISFPMQSDNRGHHCQGRGKVRLLAHLNLDYGKQILRCTCLQHFCMGIAILTLHWQSPIYLWISSPTSLNLRNIFHCQIPDGLLGLLPRATD